MPETEPGVFSGRVGAHFVLDDNAHALRLVRRDDRKDELVIYEARTFPGGAYSGCLQTLRQCVFHRALANSPYLVDILDINGDIIQDLALNKNAFNRMRRRIKTKVDKGD